MMDGAERDWREMVFMHVRMLRDASRLLQGGAHSCTMAVLLLHFFYKGRSGDCGYRMGDVAMGCMTVALKCSEKPASLKAIAGVFRYLEEYYELNSPASIQLGRDKAPRARPICEGEAVRLHERAVAAELAVLERAGFYVRMRPPHLEVLSRCRCTSAPFLQKVVCIVNDALFSSALAAMEIGEFAEGLLGYAYSRHHRALCSQCSSEGEGPRPCAGGQAFADELARVYECGEGERTLREIASAGRKKAHEFRERMLQRGGRGE